MKKVFSYSFHLFLFVWFAAIAYSCSDTALLEKNVAIKDRIWDYEDQPQITVTVTEAGKPYDIFLNLRHTAAYRFANIFVLLHQHHPSGADSTVRIEIPLAASDGRWLGSGTGNLLSYQQLIKKNYHFPDTGKYVFSFEQNMRENPLKEVTDIGIRIVPVD